MIDDIKLLEDGIHTIVPADLCLCQIVVSIKKISELVKSLDQKEFFLSLSQKLDAFLVVADYHRSEDFVSFSLRSYFEMTWTLPDFFVAEILCFYAILMIKFSALFQ